MQAGASAEKDKELSWLEDFISLANTGSSSKANE